MWKHYIAYTILLATIVVMGFFGYRMWKELRAEIEHNRLEYRQLSETLARAENNMVTKQELLNWARATGIELGEIKKDLKALNASLKAVGITIASIQGSLEQNMPSDETIPHDPPTQPEACELCDIWSYTATIQQKTIAIGEMPYGIVQFDASMPRPWTLKYDDINVRVDTAVGEQDQEGSPLVFYHTISLENLSNPALKDKLFKLKITSSSFKQTVSKTKEFRWWDPHLDLSITNMALFKDELTYAAGAELGISIMSWGKSSRDNTIRVIRGSAGISTEKSLYLGFEPVMYNLGNVIPLISDLWIGPSIAYNPLENNWGVGITLGTTL